MVNLCCLFDPQRIRLSGAHERGKLFHRIAWLWQPELWNRIVELRCHWLLRLISELQTEMSAVRGAVSMNAARLRDACCGKGGHDYRGCHSENVRHRECPFDCMEHIQ